MKAARGVVAWLLALAAALSAQWSFDRQALDRGLVLATLAIAAAALASRGNDFDRAAVGPVAPAALTAARRAALLAGVILALLGVADMGPNAFTPLGTLAWSAGVGLCLLSLIERVPRRAAPGGGGVSVALSASLAVIVAVGAVLRFHQLADLPAEAGCDIPRKLEVVLGMLAGERPIFSPVFPGREVGFFYLTALYGGVFAADQTALKVVSAAISVATIAALYGLGAGWWGRPVGLLAAAWLAVSAWHVTLSRIGYRGVLTPLLAAAAMALLDRALQRGARRDWALLGAVVGASVYTYTASLAIGLAVGVVGIATVWRRERRTGWGMALLVALVVALPIVRPLGSDFAMVSARVTGRVGSAVGYGVPSRLLENAAHSLTMFNVRGDVQFILNVPYRRALGLASGALFLCGLGVAAAGWRRPRMALLLLFLLVMQVPSILALANPIEVPAALRAGGALIPACLLAALPLPLLWRAVRRQPQRQVARWAPAAVTVLAVALLIGEAIETWRRYFTDYAAAQPMHNYPFSRTMAAAMDAYAGRGPVYLAGYPHWLDGNALRMQLQRLPLAALHELEPEQFAIAVAGAARPFLAVIRADDAARLGALRGSFPEARVDRYANDLGEAIFVTVAVP